MSKFVLTILLILISSLCISQTGIFRGRLTYTDSSIKNYETSITIRNKDSIERKILPLTNEFGFANLPFGIYSITIHNKSYRDVILDSINFRNDSGLVVNINFPGSCHFIYRKNYIPVCINGHEDKIIPIRYGFPSAKMMEKAKAGIIKLGGCIITKCAPKYYCTIHNLEL